MYYIDRHSNGSAENDEHDGDRDDGGSLSRSASENSVARPQNDIGLNINNNGYIWQEISMYQFVCILSYCANL